MTLQEFNKLYVYQADKTEAWKVLEPAKDGKYYGDCEDYCLTLQALFPQYNNGELWQCRLGGATHCVLKVNELYIDCNEQRFCTRKELESLGYTHFKKFSKAEIKWYMQTTKKFGKVPFINSKGGINKKPIIIGVAVTVIVVAIALMRGGN